MLLRKQFWVTGTRFSALMFTVLLCGTYLWNVFQKWYMEGTDELKDCSYRKICDDCCKEKRFITKYMRFFFYCTVCLSVTSLSHTSEKGKIYWNMIIKKKVWSFISFICLAIMSCSYSEIKNVIQAIISCFGLVTAASFDFLK